MADYSGAYESPAPTARSYLSDVEKAALAEAAEIAEDRATRLQCEYDDAVAYAESVKKKLDKAISDVTELKKWRVRVSHG